MELPEWTPDPHEVGHVIACRGCWDAGRDRGAEVGMVLREGDQWVLRLTVKQTAHGWWHDGMEELGAEPDEPPVSNRRYRLPEMSSDGRFVEHRGRDVVDLRCSTCRTHLGTYSPRTLGRRAEAGLSLLLPYG